MKPYSESGECRDVHSLTLAALTLRQYGEIHLAVQVENIALLINDGTLRKERGNEN